MGRVQGSSAAVSSARRRNQAAQVESRVCLIYYPNIDGLPGRGTQDGATRIARALDNANAWGSDQELRRDLAAKLYAIAETDAVTGKRRDCSRQSAELLQSLANWLRRDADAASLRELIVQGYRGDIAANLKNASTAPRTDARTAPA